MSWKDCKNILCIRPDNMGDLIMSVPAIRALKETFGASITMLTSSIAAGIAKHIPEIDDVIVFDLPWVKVDEACDIADFNLAVDVIKNRKFDAAIIFTVFSQNPLPTVMLAYLAGIPRRLAYCRENPYHLLTDWVADKEPYDVVKHQVRRDLDLVASVDAFTSNENLYLKFNKDLWEPVSIKLCDAGFSLNEPWLIMHPGVSEKKREFSLQGWIEAGKRLIAEGYQVLLTGSSTEKHLTDKLEKEIGAGSFSVAGLFNLDEFICLVKHAPLLISVNTGTIHIAAATGIKVVVLYAQTNPQHTPWNVPNKVLEFPITAALQSKNEIISYLRTTIYKVPASMPATDEIIAAVNELLSLPNLPDRSFHDKPNENLVLAAS